MDEIARLLACEDIRAVKARYFRGVDTADSELVRGILAEDCVLDYRGCCTDPATKRDFFPAMNIVMRGSAGWSSTGLRAMGIVSVHHSHNGEIEVSSATMAHAIWSMTDRLFMPPGKDYAVMTGYGYYHETYEKIGGAWKVKTLRIERLRVEAQ
ncbi:nuclear transport factor 2 family protein [Acidocella sp.]|uniref:nuclear transport factor 2 family protein n=1 Tax=Acidocella sp. TaxID=50710 RepID=UPI0026077BD7|nr:nuclear transport factor 2 family protein [Acidocella sp.]